MVFPFSNCPSVGNLVLGDPVLLSTGEIIRLDLFFLLLFKLIFWMLFEF